MDKPISEWQLRLRGMDADQLLNAWSAKAENEHSWVDEANFHVAAAERMKLLGFMAADLEEKQRKELRLKADDVLAKIKKQFENRENRIKEFEAVIESSDKYFAAYGTPTARHYMYEQGLINLLGDRLDIV